MRKLYGEKAKEVFEAQARSPEAKKALMELASVDPDTFVKLFSPSSAQSQGSQTDSGGSVNTTALDQSNQSGRAADSGTKEYYDQLRKTKPQSYYSTDVQLTMHKAAQANPAKFFGKPS